jgi:hypothetical protein
VSSGRTLDDSPQPDDALPHGVPNLGDVAGDWVQATELAHLPSLRNQWGQGHVNYDLASLSWLAAPPYTFGYHTGVFRLDGAVLEAERFLWKPWGVQREHTGEAITVRTDTRMALADNLLLWRLVLTNRTNEPVECTASQDLFAMVAHTETGWGWLYDVPWTSGNHHDFMTLERIRRTTRAHEQEAQYLLGPGSRVLRLGKPRLPGIQRSAETERMSLAYELPRHVSDDTTYAHPEGAHATVRGLEVLHGEIPLLEAPAEVSLRASSESALGSFELGAGQRVRLQLRPDAAESSGIVFTHGNHPDSLQLGIDGGRLWIGIAGEQEYADLDLVVHRWYDVEITIDASRVVLRVDHAEVAATQAWTTSTRWKPLLDATTVAIADERSSARASYAFDSPPDRVEQLGSGARASWVATLEPGETRCIGIVCSYGDDEIEVAARATQVAAHFDAELAATEDGYRAHWRAMFTPGNKEFSGHLPVLNTADSGLAKSYYMGALLALYMRNIQISAEPIFLTGGPRLGPTTTYFWDHTEWSRLYALLEPVGMRRWLLRALGSPYDRCFGFDARNGGPLGNAYASNYYSLFRLVEHYVCISGDRGFLSELAGSMSVLDHLRQLAYGWQSKGTEETGGLLADFGPDPWRLLECVPNYVNVVASFNAAYVGMMRSLAGLLASLGRDTDAVTASRDAEVLAHEVLRLYVRGGRWSIRHPGSNETIGHCLDFGLVAAHLHADLNQTQRDEMTDFVEASLLTSTWMRALAADDPVAPFSDRPDHGARGAFGAWLGVTAHGLAKLGRKDLAEHALSVAHASGSGALWGQAMEIVNDEAGEWVRVAADGASNRDSIAGVATAEAVLSALFDFDPSFQNIGMVLPTSLQQPGIGVLTNLNVGSSGRNVQP